MEEVYHLGGIWGSEGFSAFLLSLSILTLVDQDRRSELLFQCRTCLPVSILPTMIAMIDSNLLGL